MTTKWFDYRRLHPMQATYYFVKCYNDAYREFYRRAINAEAAPYVRGIKGTDFLRSKERLMFWSLRQMCDRFGMRYDFFLTFAMSWHHRMTANGKVYAPRPSQFSNENLFSDALLAWEELCSASLQVAKDPYYRVSNYAGSRDQQAHEDFIVGQIRRRNVPRFSLHVALYELDVLRIEKALCEFDFGLVKEALTLTGE